QALAASIEAPRFDLARLQGLSPDIQESAGRLRIDVQLRGTLDRPTADGVIELQDGRLRHSAIGEPYTDLQARAVFKGNRLDIERFQAASGAGTARLQGWLETSGQALGRANLTLNANEFTAINTQALEAVVSSNVTLRGSQEALTTSGNVTIPQARIRYEDLPGTGPSEVEPWELTVAGVYGPGPVAATFEAAAASPAAEPEAPPLSFLRADIQLDMPRNVWIQGKGTAIELSGRLQLKKDQSRPFVLAGEVETLRGFATFLGRKFNVEKGIVTFTGSEDVNPLLDISASYEVADYTVYVNVTGQSKEPEITYNSEPELDQQDILSLLIFGKTSDRLTRSEQTTLGSKAQQFAGGLAAGMLEQTVGKALGLDTVAIELGDQGSASSVGAGRYLTQDIYVEYQRKFHDPRQGNRTGNAVTVEYSISRGLKVEATGSDYGETAIDFVWSHDY
ncbi:MAG: translocation/assembly module TamB domain-containing protein, partial [Gammaproteobacteria bacterium]